VNPSKRASIVVKDMQCVNGHHQMLEQRHQLVFHSIILVNPFLCSNMFHHHCTFVAHLSKIGGGQWPRGKKIHFVDRVVTDSDDSGREPDEFNEEALFICSAVIVTLQSLSSILMTCLSSPTSSKHHHLPLPLTLIIESYLPPIKKWWDEDEEEDEEDIEDEVIIMKQLGPKRGLSAYMFFCEATRPQIKDKNEDMSFDEVNIAVGEAWRGLSREETKPFEKLAKEDKARYEREKQVCSRYCNLQHNWR
jgi:hypothetical protein